MVFEDESSDDSSSPYMHSIGSTDGLQQVPFSLEEPDYNGLELDTMVFSEKHGKASQRQVAFKGTYTCRRFLACAEPETQKLWVIFFLWSWWSERNSVNHKKGRRSAEVLEALINSTVREWVEFLGKKQPKPKHMERWKPPPDEVIKINLDAAFTASTGDGGWGPVARDHEGDLVGLAVGRLAHLTDPLQAETEALRHAIAFAEDQGMGRVIFETDCSNLQQAISSTAQDREPLGIFFREAKFRLQFGFMEWQVVYFPRMCNTAAHVLAARGMVGAYDNRVWQSNFPNDVTRVVAADLAGPP
ncbi:hypothetical protein ZWY2020_048519 [Hordeum vulgare]|nr:hypothetical protein ZWY2020_048519 [Hordeum vulgare]